MGMLCAEVQIKGLSLRRTYTALITVVTSFKELVLLISLYSSIEAQSCAG